MKNTFRRSQFTAFVLLGSLTAPLLMPSAQAKPSRNSPSNDDRNREDRADRNITVVGVVTRDLRGNDRFDIRLDSGRTVEVISRDREPKRLSKGDRVELRGDFEKELFIADRVRILDNRDGNNGNGNNGNGNNGGNDNRATRLEGRVTKDFFGRDFEILGDNGLRTRVRSLRAEPIRLSRGDVVEVRGAFEGRLFMAREVNIQRNEDRQKVDFPATVTRRTDAGRITVRGDNGRNYVVISNSSLLKFDKEDRVRIKGFINGDIVAADSVILLKNR